MDLKTPLYQKHLDLKAKMVPFAGYIMPVQYPTGIIKEHMAVREKAGIFDVSHMGEIIISGDNAKDSINNLLTNDFSIMNIGQIRYSPMCNEKGGIIDDLIVYKLEEEKFMLVVNACNRLTDLKWIEENLTGDVVINDISDSTALIALQGPVSKDILLKLTTEDSLPTKYYTFIGNTKLSDINCLISRTGYTGEHGYEIYINTKDAEKVWEEIMAAGEEFGLLPCGLGSRDTLRFEASMPLYGNEMKDDITPLEVGLNFAVKMNKPNFIGKKALEENPLTRKRMGLEVTGRGIIREDTDIFINDKKVGITTSGTHAPYLGKALAMALVDIEHAKEGVNIEADVRGRRIEAKITELPFIKK